ncbi:hypothetical protein [Myroides fluvii]|uniref:hypothetical protein n=1 Tax=Myroides fluvii TaxID=2572594 RepID=UPI00131C0D14|nr:hypothetical protein [Myroides fluvii]
MIRKVIPLFALILSTSAMAQVGIGTKKAASAAQLDIVAEKKGVLIPRVKLEVLTQYAPIEGDQVESLLVYHTGEHNLKAGFYYWRNNSWIPLLSGDTVIDRMNNTFTIGANPTKNNEESLIITDTENHSVYLAIREIANNSTFVTNLVDNNEFITKLGDSIDFINQITNNSEFVENIINKLKGKYGNVNYNATTHTFVYYDDQGVEHAIDWSSLNTTNLRFTLENDFLIVWDSAGDSVQLAVAEIANNSTFVTNLVDNNEFITKLGDNIDFINQITNNNEFVENIINKLKGKYGNVNYNATTHTFVYYDDQGVEHAIDWSSLNTTNLRFTLENDFLIVWDSAGDSVQLAVAEIANNSTFVTNLVDNNEFITKLGDNIDFINQITNNNEFVENIINKLKGKYGNVNYNATTHTFVYYDDQGVEHAIDWSSLNTTNLRFTLENDFLIVWDSAGDSVQLAVAEIANNSTFVTNLVDNNEFITKLGDNIDFINQITNNSEFVENIINKLKGKYGNVNYNATTHTFVYYDDQGVEHAIDWSSLNTTNLRFTLENDFLIVWDSAGDSVQLAVAEIANNSTFVTNLVDNNEFITKLGDSIDFINQITNNSEFVENIINKLKGKYGNVNYNATTHTFVYYDDQGVEHAIDWSSLNTTNLRFTLENDFLIVWDSAGDSVQLAVAEIANNSTFVTNLVDNNEFITKLGDNIDFINQITNNSEFVENIINKLKGKYGNVNYNATTHTFVYYDDQGVEHAIDWSSLNTTNLRFTLENDFLIVWDSAGDSVQLAVAEIANNSTFVTNLVDNNEFITKLGDNIDFINQITNNNEFVENIINKLKGKYGNVNYNATTHTFVYYDDQGVEHAIDWSSLNTTNLRFTLENDFLIVWDSAGDSVQLAVAEIANNSTFVTNLVDNNEFITKLGDNIDFINQITNNNEFIENIIEELKGKYGNVGYDTTTHSFFYYDENKQPVPISWDVLGNTKIKTFAVNSDFLIITDTEDREFKVSIDELGEIIANNDVFVTNLVDNNEFITKLGDSIDFINQITNNSEFVENIINKLKGKYGNVNYNATTHTFVYYDDQGVEHAIDWSSLNTTNLRFTLENDFLIVWDSAGDSVQLAVAEIANNSTFVTNLVDNNEFITKLGDNIDFINQITNNNEFIENIIEELKGKYGNVGYDTTTHSFFYYDENKQPVPISWDVLGNTKIKTFAVNSDFLIITDTEDREFKVSIDELGEIIANNDVFVTNLVDNNEFITKLGDSIDFINQITNNSEFVENIINKLKGKYGNVNYNATTHTFVYYDDQGVEHAIDWSSLNTTNLRFTLENDFLIVWDSAGDSVQLAVAEIANNSTFVTNLVDNNEFITKLGDNIDFINQITNNNEFIENIIEELKGKYGNVGYDTTTHSFFYYDENKQPVPISWDVLGNTKIKTFAVNSDFLIITDTEDREFKVSIDELGEIIANNDVFVTNLVDNQQFITKLGDSNEFKTIIKNNAPASALTLTDTTVNVDAVQAGFSFNNGLNTQTVQFSESLTALAKGKDANLLTEYYFKNETGGQDSVVIQVTQDIIQDFETILNDNSVKMLLQQFILEAQGNISVVRNTDGDLIIKTPSSEFNLTTEIKTKETTTTLTSSGAGVYVYKNEEAIKTNGAGTTINVVEDVENNFQTIVDNTNVKNILNEFISNAVGVVDYSYDEVIKPEKWLNTTKKVAVRMFDITLGVKTNVVEITGDFAEVVIHARLINKTTNSITEGVIRKKVVNGNTQLVLGIPGIITTYHPVGTYYLILEYVKK